MRGARLAKEPAAAGRLGSSDFSAILALVISLLAATTAVAQSNMTPPNDRPEVARVETPNGLIFVTLDQMKALEAEFLDVLSRSKPISNYQHLIDELKNHSAAMIGYGGVARIGSWRLIYKDGENYLERQQMPRAPHMLFFYARVDTSGPKLTITGVNHVFIHGKR